MKEKIYVEIAGIRLGIVTEEGATYVKEIAAGVENDVTKMIKSQKNCSLVEASLFTSMNYYSRATEGEKKVKNLETQVALYQANLNRLKRENEELRIKLLNNANNGNK
ncbi:MAG: cell division protein ZapA [Clostridia bacterium]|nr:cell division protein ZapA [Clostridia bacterium]